MEFGGSEKAVNEFSAIFVHVKKIDASLVTSERVVLQFTDVSGQHVMLAKHLMALMDIEIKMYQ